MDISSMGSKVSYSEVVKLAKETGSSERSIAAKLRYAGKEVERKPKTKAYTDEQEVTIREMAEKGAFIEDIAEALGKTNKQIRGKLLSMKLYGVKQKTKQAPKAKTYTDEQEATIKKMAGEGAFIEDIAEALGKSIKQIRGKLLSMKLYEVKQKNKQAPKQRVYTPEVIANITNLIKAGKSEEDIAKKLNLNVTGLHRKLVNLGLAKGKAKAKFWTDEKKATLEANIDKTNEELAEMLQTTPLVIAKGKKMIEAAYNVEKED